MRVVYKSPLFLFLIMRLLWLAFILFPIIMLYSVIDREYLIAGIGAVILMIGVIIFLKTVRVVVYSDHIKIMGFIFRRQIKYSDLKWASQVPMIASKMIFLRLKSRMPFGFYIYPTTYFVFLDDLFNLDIHDSVDYINDRVQSARPE